MAVPFIIFYEEGIIFPVSHEVFDNKKFELLVKQRDHNGNTVKKNLGMATYIEEITKTLETNAINLTLEFLYGGEWNTITLPRRHLQDKDFLQYADFGLNVHRGNIKYVVEYIQAQEANHTPKIVHEGIGFDTIVDKDTGAVKHIFKGSKCLGMKSTYVGSYNIEPKGSMKAFRQFLQENVYGTPLELAVVVGLAGALIGFISEDVQCPNLFTGIYGDSSTGKSSFAVLAVSMGSKPCEGENSLFTDWYGTDNALMGKLVGNFGYPIVFDEANKYQGRDFAHLVYCMEGGTQKQRLTREGKTQETGTYHTSIIATAEKPISNKSSQNAGQGVRILEFGNIPWTRNAEHSEAVKAFALENYGFGVLYLARHILKLGKAKVLKRFKKNREKYLSRSMVNDAFTPRLSIKYGILLTTLQLANEAMGLSLSDDLVLKMLLKNERSTAGTRDIGKKAYEYLVSMFNTHPEKFSLAFSRNFIMSSRRETWGIQDPQRNVFTSTNGNYRTIIWFSAEAFKSLLEKGKFESVEVVLERLRAGGYLDCPTGKKDSRYYRKRKITSTGSKEKVYGILLFDDPSVDSKRELEIQLEELERMKKSYCEEF